jgi:EAL domain-containing protein (putative c-di-GMP-specific phosphodiesterase class I)
VDRVADLLRRGFFSMAFQPIREMATAQKVGFEALLRGPKGTPLASPGSLFNRQSPLSPDLLHQLDFACIGAALRTGRLLPGAKKLFINVHGETLCHAAKRGREIFPLLEALGMDPGRIVLEIAETTEESHIKAILRTLKPFRERGVQVALDDVGVRYPWLYHLLYLEPDFFKVDRAFVKGINRIPRKADLLYGLLALAERTGTRLITEGIETREDWMVARDLGIPLGQGFWLGTPKPAEEWLGAEDRAGLFEEPVPGAFGVSDMLLS